MNNQIDSFIKWLNTFDLKAPYSTIEAISDGVALSEVLQQIAPEWFTDVWRSKIKSDVGNNWRLKVSNLKKIVEAVMEYYNECLNQPLSQYVKPDAAKIGEQYNVTELRKLLQLVLGCVINCSNKQKYITTIMQMEESVQQTIMQNIQELEGGMYISRLSLGANLNIESTDANQLSHQKLLSELQFVTELKDQLAQKCHDLVQQLSIAREEKNLLFSENGKLLKRLEETESVNEFTPNLQYSGLRKQIDILKEEIFKYETSRDDYRLKVELLEKEIFDLQSKHDELQKIADETNNLKDEVDALRETADKVTKYELTIESYKKKMDDLIDLRRQIKILEDKNIEYIELKAEYEEEIKKGLIVRNHLDLCKHQLSESHNKLEEQINKNDKLEIELKKLQLKLNSVKREKERLIVERDTLKESNDELKFSQLQPHENLKPTVNNATSSLELIAADIKKILRFEHENKVLPLERLHHNEKLSTPSDSNDSASQLHGLKAQKDSKKTEDIDARLEDFNDGQYDNIKMYNNNIIRQQSQQQNKELKIHRMERERLILQLDEKDMILQTLKQKLISLQELISQKEYENIASEERYKKYVDKAKSVIKSLDSKQSNPCDILLLHNQIVEKQKTIEHMKQSLRDYQLLSEMEEKLMISAFYYLGFAKQREFAEQRLINFNSNKENVLSKRYVHCNISNSIYNF